MYYTYISPVIPKMTFIVGLFFILGSSQDSQIAFDCYVSSFSLNLEQWSSNYNPWDTPAGFVLVSQSKEDFHIFEEL